MTKLFGREQEQRRLLDPLGRVRSDGGIGVVLDGDPGIGKSTMLDWLSSRSAGFTVLRARGHDADAGTSTGARPWAAQARLLLTSATNEPIKELPNMADRLESLSERERTVALAVVCYDPDRAGQFSS